MWRVCLALVRSWICWCCSSSTPPTPTRVGEEPRGYWRWRWELDWCRRRCCRGLSGTLRRWVFFHSIDATHSTLVAERRRLCGFNGRWSNPSAQVMRGYFPSILALAQSLLRSPDPCMVPFAGRMYHHSFSAFDSYCQQVGVCLSVRPSVCKNSVYIALVVGAL